MAAANSGQKMKKGM